MERDQRVIVTKRQVSPQILLMAGIQSILNSPMPASPLSHFLRCKGRRRDTHRLQGGSVQQRFLPFFQRLPSLQQPQRPLSRLPGPNGAEWGGNLSAPPRTAGGKSAPLCPSPQSLRSGTGGSELQGVRNRERGTCTGKLVPWSRPQPGEVSQLPGVAATPTCEQEASGALAEGAGAGPALRGKDLGARNCEGRLRLQVGTAPASPGREFDFRVWP